MFRVNILKLKEINIFANLNFGMNKYFLLIVFLFSTAVSKAQYLNEIGLFGGGSNYSGDIGNEIYIMPNKVAGGLIYRRNLNTRLTLRGTGSIYPLKDNDANSLNPVRQERGFKFSNTLYEVALGLEFNYLDYDITSSSTIATPYLIFEVAGYYYNVVSSVTNGNINYTSNIGYAIPLGIGFKSKITRRIAYAVELRARYALTDDLDFSDEKISKLNFGNTKNNDWYFFTGVGLTYSFGRPPCAVQPRY